MHSQIPDKKEVTVYQRKIFSNMKVTVSCLPDLLEKHSKPGLTQSTFKTPKDFNINSHRNSFSSPVEWHLSNQKSILSVSTVYTLISEECWLLTVGIKKGKGQNSLANHHSFSAMVTPAVTKGCFFHHINISTSIKYPKALSVKSWSSHTPFSPESRTNSTMRER